MVLAPVDNVAYKKSISAKKARYDLRALFAENNCAPLMVRLAWHNAGTRDADTMTGGANKSIRNEREYTPGANTDVKKAIDWMGEIWNIPAAPPYLCSEKEACTRTIVKPMLVKESLFRFNFFGMKS